MARAIGSLMQLASKISKYFILDLSVKGTKVLRRSRGGNYFAAIPLDN